MENVEILGATIIIDGDHTNTEIDLGAVMLSFENRSYALDVVKSTRTFEHGETKVDLEFKTDVDTETFPDCKFDLETVDLIEPNLKAELYYKSEIDWEYATLFVTIGGMTKAIDLTVEN